MDTQRDTIRFIGKVEFDVFSEKGEHLSHQEIDNLIVTVGKAHLAGLANGVVLTPFKYIAIGGSATAPAAGNTTLGQEFTTFGGDRKLGSVDRITTTTANDTGRIIASFTFVGGVPGANVNEAGLFDAVSAGVLCSRVTPTPVAISVGNTLQVTWTLQVA